jgi:hypothetical protein
MGGVSTIVQSNNITRIARANYRAAVAQAKNTNNLEVAKGNFAEYMRSLNNQIKVNAASKEYNFQREQLAEELRARQGAGLNTQAQLAAARGSLRAQAGYVGVGGGSADLMDTMVRLQGEMDQEMQGNALRLMASRGAKQTAQVMTTAYKGMDISRTFGQFDFSQHIAPKDMNNRLLKLVGVAVATYFGGPQAGEAAANAAVAEWQAQNGDYQGMGISMAKAGEGLAGAMQGMSQRGGKSWASATFGYDDGTGPRETSAGTGARITSKNTDNSKNYDTSTKGLGWFGSGGSGGGAW